MGLGPCGAGCLDHPHMGFCVRMGRLSNTHVVWGQTVFGRFGCLYSCRRGFIINTYWAWLVLWMGKRPTSLATGKFFLQRRLEICCIFIRRGKRKKKQVYKITRCGIMWMKYVTPEPSVWDTGCVCLMNNLFYMACSSNLVNDLILRISTSYYLMMNEWPWINTIPQTKQKLESKMVMNHIIPLTRHPNSVLAY